MSAVAAPPDELSGLTADAAAVDLGLIQEVRQHTFVLSNSGPAPATDIVTRVSCNCLVSRPEKTTLAPGESGAVTITVDPNRQGIGRHTKVVEVDYRMGEDRRLRLELSFQNRPDVIIPEQVELWANPGQPATGRFDVIDHRVKALRVARISTSTPALTAEVVARPEGEHLPSRACQVRVHVPRMEGGERSEYVHLHTDDPLRPVLTVRVHAVTTQRVRVAPSVLHLTRDVDGSQSGRLFVSDSRGEPVEFDALSSGHPDLDCRTEGRATAGPRIVAVRLAASREAPPSPLWVRLSTRQPVHQEFQVEVVPCAP